jgi:hypothetical protein
MKCPHCQYLFQSAPIPVDLLSDCDGSWSVVADRCPGCRRAIILLQQRAPASRAAGKQILVYPRAPRPPAPKAVPAPIASDYNEACLVLADSPKASAALARRCLQQLLRAAPALGHGGGALEWPPGAGAADLVDVTPADAERMLDALVSMFDIYYVQPARLEEQRRAVKARLDHAARKARKRRTTSTRALITA